MHRRLFLATSGLLFVMLGCRDDAASPTEPPVALQEAVPGNVWVRLADLPTPRVGAALAAVPKPDGTTRLFAIAGGLRRMRVLRSGDTLFSSVPVGTVTEYLPATGRWVRRTDAPYVWQVVPQAAVLDGKIYLPGGLRGNGEDLYAAQTMAVYTIATIAGPS